MSNWSTLLLISYLEILSHLESWFSLVLSYLPFGDHLQLIEREKNGGFLILFYMKSSISYDYLS